MKESKTAPLNFPKHAAIGSFLALGITLLLLLLFSYLIASGRVSERFMGAITAISLFVGSTVGAFFAIARVRKKALLVGLLQGAILYAITLVGSAFSGNLTLFGGLSVFLLAAALLGGVAAGLFFARPKKRRI